MLQGRISVLYNIQEDERLIDSLYEASKIHRNDSADSMILEKPAPEEPVLGDLDQMLPVTGDPDSFSPLQEAAAFPLPPCCP